jgi:capsular polysaccharide biosynthesis protein
MGQKMLVLNIMKNLKKRLKLILGITFLSVGVVWFLLLFVLVPEYKATSQIIVEQLAGLTPTPDSPLAEEAPGLGDIYRVTLRSPEFLESVIDNMDTEMTVNELHEKITVSEVIDSQVFNITVTSLQEEEAVQIANTVALTFKEEIPEMVPADNVLVIPNIADQVPASPFEENVVFSLGIAGAFGFITGTLIAFIVEMLNMLFKTGRKENKDAAAKLQTVFK